MLQAAEDAGTLLSSYEEAVLYCTFLIHNGYSDWRLPTIHELYKLKKDATAIPHHWTSDLVSEYWGYLPRSVEYRRVLPVRDIVD
jgi:hypothetical protein